MNIRKYKWYGLGVCCSNINLVIILLIDSSGNLQNLF